MQLFDNILILSKGGVTAYAGPVANLQSYFEGLGFTFEDGENKIDVCLDAVSGTIKSSNDSVTPDTIPEIWKRKQEESAPYVGYQTVESVQIEKEFGDAVMSPNSNNESEDLSSELRSDDDDFVSDGVNSMIPVAQSLPRDKGSLLQFFVWFFLCLCLPFLCLLPFYVSRWRTRKAQYGSYFGVTWFFFVFPTISLVQVLEAVEGDVSTTGPTFFFLFYTLAFIGFYYLLFLIPLIILIVLYIRKQDVCVSVGTHINMGVLFGPLMLPLLIFLFVEKLRYACLLGLGLWGVVFSATLFSWQLLQALGGYNGQVLQPAVLNAQIWFILILSIGGIIMAVSAYRWKRIPSSDRRIANVFTQSYLQFKRACIQQSRDLFGICFDLILPLFSGASVGLLSLGKQWSPPMTEISPWAVNATRCLGCFGGKESVCCDLLC